MGTRAVIFDKDGVLADTRHRQRQLEGENPNWDLFFKLSVFDKLLEPAAGMLKSFRAAGYEVIIVTGQSERYRDCCMEWLERHGLITRGYDYVIMRDPDDRSTAAEFKRRELRNIREGGHDVEFAFDDCESVIEMYRQEGVPMPVHVLGCTDIGTARVDEVISGVVSG